MRTPRLALLATLGVFTAILAGCTASVSATVDPDKIASLAEDALENQLGSRPEIDCGDDSVPLKQGTVVPCVLTDPAGGSEFDAEVTLKKVEGTNVTVSVQVADAANGAPDATPSAAPDEQGGGTTLTLSSSEIAATAEKALSDAAIFPNPAVVCPGSTHEVEVGYTLECSVTNGSEQRKATVTISAVDGSSYSVDVKVLD